ncbi:MAG: ABC transporter permease [Candidatus Rokuibacteriota bacterium]
MKDFPVSLPRTAAERVRLRWPFRVARHEHLPGVIWTLVRTDFKVRYHGTAMGFLWALLKPLAMLLVLVSVFSFVFASHPHYALNLVVALFIWDFFAEGTKVGLTSLHAKAYLLTKTRFPRWIVVVASLSNVAVTLAVTAIGMTVVVLVAGRPVTAAGLAWFAAYLVQLAMIVVGISLAGSVLFLRYRDLNQVWEVVIGAGFFAAPVIYPLDILPERFHAYLFLWPPTPVIQFARAVLVDGVIPSPRAHALLALATIAALAAGIVVFRRHAPGIAERL